MVTRSVSVIARQALAERYREAKEQAENHYPEYEKFEVQAIEIERRSK